MHTYTKGDLSTVKSKCSERTHRCAAAKFKFQPVKMFFHHFYVILMTLKYNLYKQKNRFLQNPGNYVVIKHNIGKPHVSLFEEKYYMFIKTCNLIYKKDMISNMVVIVIFYEINNKLFRYNKH